MSNAGFEDVNGFYYEIKKNVFEMTRSDNNRSYQIGIESSTPFSSCVGGDVWSIKRVDGFNDVCIYVNSNKDFIENNDWKCIVGDKPFPLIQNVSLSSNEKKENNLDKLINEQNNKRKNWKPKSNILYWSRQKQNWLKGRILEINQGFIYIETEKKTTKRMNKEEKKNDDEKSENNQEIKPSFYEKICIEINSELIQPDIDETFYKRKLKKKQQVLVWSRNELKYKQGIIRDITNDFVYIECGSESRYIQKNSVLIQC